MQKNEPISFDLPWPPSINHYWRHTKQGHYISKEGRLYRDTVALLCSKYRDSFPKEQRLTINIDAMPPDNRKRDLDNILKSLLDALQYARIYEDDSQIDRLFIERKTALDGKVTIMLNAI